MIKRGVRILVIGGGGFIGRALSLKLSNMGRKITILGRREAAYLSLPENTNYVRGDFADTDLVRRLLDNHEEIINLAYASTPNTLFDNPIADLQVNLAATIQLFLEVAVRGLNLIVVSSGGTVYGQTEASLLSESDPTWPISPYGINKLTIEHYAHLYAVTKGLRYTCLRIANAYGAGQEPFTGQGLISTAIASSAQGKAITIFGDGGAIRDYIYVDDIAEAICLSLSNGKRSNTYNIGSGRGRSINEVMSILEPLMNEVGYHISCEYMPERSFDVRRNILNCSKAHTDFGWSANTDFIKGLRLTRDWILEGGYAR
jgi:UDP-glucose 4-epimerase